MAARKTKSFIDTFEQYTTSLFAPRLFRRWAAISLISSVLERRVWTYTRGSELYPNLYVILVGPPSAGKGIVLKEVITLLKTLTNPVDLPSTTHLHLAPTSLTTASLVDELKEAERKIVKPNQPYQAFHSLQVVIPEFSDFAPMYDPAFMSALQTLHDGYSVPFSSRRRGKDINIKIHNPLLSLIAGSTPSYLSAFMPEGAWDQGFISRTVLVFAEPEMKPDLFLIDTDRPRLLDMLKHDLSLMFGLSGLIEWEPETRLLINQWIQDGLTPEPEHRKLQHYNGRRITQLIKLLIVSAVDRGGFSLTAEDFARAKGWLLEAESQMIKIFQFATGAGDAQVIEDAWFFLSRFGGPCPEPDLIKFIQDRVSSMTVMKVIEMMVKGGSAVIADSAGPGGTFRYKAGVKGPKK